MTDHGLVSGASHYPNSGAVRRPSIGPALEHVLFRVEDDYLSHALRSPPLAQSVAAAFELSHRVR